MPVIKSDISGFIKKLSSKIPRVDKCFHGHPYTQANSYISPSGSRFCRICKKAYQIARRKRLKREEKQYRAA